MKEMMNGGLSVDDRGSIRFVNDFNFEGVKRFYQVENHRQGFVRAWHGHMKEGKYVYVAKGSILLGIVDLQSANEITTTYVLSANSPKVAYISPGHANGFMNLEEGTIVLFFSTSTLEESKDDDIRFPYDKWNIWDIVQR